jgi:hypothetical protein
MASFADSVIFVTTLGFSFATALVVQKAALGLMLRAMQRN